MRRSQCLLHWISAVILATTLTFSTVGTGAASEGRLTSRFSQKAAKRLTSDKSLPTALNSVLPKVKEKSRIPVLLPSELPDPIAKAKHALVEKATANGYVISLYYKLDIGDAGFAAYFSAQAPPSYNPRELKSIHDLKLARGIRGFFRPISCGGSCSPANIWWEEGAVLYQIQLELPYGFSEQEQKKAIAVVANSAILAGPR